MTTLKTRTLQAKESYEKDGFAIIRNVISQDLLGEINEHLNWLSTRYPDLRPEHYHHTLMRDDAFWVRVISDESLLKIAKEFLGEDLVCFTSHYVCKPPLDGHPVLWHQDGAYWKIEPMNAITLWLAVDQTTGENGCLKMLKGTQNLPLSPIVNREDVPNMLASSIDRKHIEEDKIVEIHLEPGDVSIHHPHIIHGSEENLSNQRRCGLDIGYMAATSSISNKELYLNPVLVSGHPSANEGYRPWPLFDPEQSMPFKGDKEWDLKAQLMSKRHLPLNHKDEDIMAMTERMQERLAEGTVKQARTTTGQLN